MEHNPTQKQQKSPVLEMLAPKVPSILEEVKSDREMLKKQLEQMIADGNRRIKIADEVISRLESDLEFAERVQELFELTNSLSSKQSPLPMSPKLAELLAKANAAQNSKQKA